MCRSPLGFLPWLAAIFLFPITLMAQFGGISGSASAPGQGLTLGNVSTVNGLQSKMSGVMAHKYLAGRVYSPKGEPVANALVEINNNVGAKYQIVSTDKQGDFQAEFTLFDVEEGENFVAVLKVTRKGFEVAHRLEEMKGAVNQLNIAINLRAHQEEDPSLLSQAELIKGVAPRLRQLGPADGLQDKQQKDYARGVQDFLDRHHLEDAVSRLAKVVMLDPQCLKCQTMLALAEMSWGDWDDPRRELVDAVNTSIKNSKLARAEPLLVYGVMVSWKHEPEHAAPYFAEALKFSPTDPLALQELGRAQCQELSWYSGSQALKKALAAGAGPDARLMYAESLLWVETPAKAQEQLNLYLDGRNIKSMPLRVRTLQEHIQAGKKDQTIILAARAKAQSRGEVPLDYLNHPPKNLPDFQPAADQAQTPVILAAVGKNVAEFFANLPNICSIVEVNAQRLNREGKGGLSEKFKYRYLALAPSHPWGPSVDEYRADWTGRESSQSVSDNAMLTEGFVSATLVFHPSYQSGSNFRLLGSQKIKGRSTFVMAYAQDPKKSSLSGTFQYGAIINPTYTQGMAWIDAENYQIVRLTSDLVEPLPQVRLDRETTDINFTEVHFKRQTQGFWLPEAVTVSLDWNGRIYRNNHAYSEFLLSDVQATQKIEKPKEAKETTENGSDPGPSSNVLGNPALSPVPSAN